MPPDSFLSKCQMQEIRSIESPEFRRKVVELIERLRGALSSVTEMNKVLKIQDASYAELSQVATEIDWESENQKVHDVSRIDLLIAQLTMAKYTELSKK